MRTLDCRKEPVKVFGLPAIYTTGQYNKLEPFFEAKMPWLKEKVLRSNGGRICFRTDSPKFKLKARIKIAWNSETHSLFDTTGFVVYIGERRASRYAGTMHMVYTSNTYTDKQSAESNDMVVQMGNVQRTDGEYYIIEKTFEKSTEMEDVTIFLPGVCYIDYCKVAIEDNSQIGEPTPYAVPEPIVFYGSSITAGGATSRVSNSYISLLSRWLDADYINYGFAGSALGEIEMAEFLAGIKMSAFVMDYDHNAPTVEHLKMTHEPFYKKFRSIRPDTPCIIMSRPNYSDNDDSFERREIIRQTYENAKRVGDNNVYFIDGETLFGNEERHACTIDLCHPNDFGFMQMAKTIYPVLKKIIR